MRVLALSGLLVLLAAGGCGGEGQSAPDPAADGRGDNEVARCWKEAAAEAQDVADSARFVLPGAITRARQQYAKLRAAAARGDKTAFIDARTDFFRTLKQIHVGRSRFETKHKRAGATLSACSKEEELEDAVPACWRAVAATYDESLLAAESALGPLVGTLFFTVQRLVDALEGGAPDAVQRAEAKFLASALRVQQAADRYAESRERGGDLYTQCADA